MDSLPSGEKEEEKATISLEAHKPTKPGRCQFFIKRKNRCCTVEHLPCSDYCLLHQPAAGAPTVLPAGLSCCTADPSTSSQQRKRERADGEQDTGGANSDEGLMQAKGAEPRARVPCPINPSHSVWANKLQRHLNICPDRNKGPSLSPFYSEDINILFPSEIGAVPTQQQGTSRGDDAGTRGFDEVIGEPRTEEHSGGGGGGGGAEDNGAAHFRDLPLRKDLQKEGDAKESCTRSSSHSVEGASLVTMEDYFQWIDETHSVLLHAIGGITVDHTMLSHLTTCNTDTGDRESPRDTSKNTGSFGTGYVEQGCMKHTTQQASLLAKIPSHYLKKADEAGSELTSDGKRDTAVTFLELGAGKGGLANALGHLWIQSCGDGEKTPEVIVVDRGYFRDMKDRELRQRGTPITRIVMNVKDFSLPLLAQHHHPHDDGGGCGRQRRYVAIGKHLCGGCTDLALTAAARSHPFPSSVAGGGGRSPVVDCIVIATCCHHLCTWPTFFGRFGETLTGKTKEGESPPTTDVFRSRRHFEIVRSMCSWATAGERVAPEKKSIGRKAKQIIDCCRVLALRTVPSTTSSGEGRVAFPTVRLVEYAPISVTEENIAIVALGAN